MNVNDTTAPPVDGDRMKMMFDQQNRLHRKYMAIEQMSGVGLSLVTGVGSSLIAFHIDAARWQYIMKDYAWRVTEELTESTEAYRDEIHRQEEGIDALHFLIELCIVIKIGPVEIMTELGLDGTRSDMLETLCRHSNPFILPLPDFCEKESNIHRAQFHPAAYAVIENLGKAMNCLKNKPWKQTQMETDTFKFQHFIAIAFLSMIEYLVAIGMSDGDIYEMYFKKSAVNKFRQESNY